MIKTTDWRNLIGHKDSIKMLLCLMENGPMKKTDIYHKVSRNSNMADRINSLEGLGVIRVDQYGRYSMIGLTRAGELVAGHLSMIGKIVDEPDE